MREHTFALLKPEAIRRGLVGEILRRFERAGLRLTALKMLQAPRSLAAQHYGAEIAQKYGEAIRQQLIDYICSGPIIVMILSGPGAIRRVRQIAGEKADPAECPPGTIRGDWGDDTRAAANAEGRALRNLIHTADSPEAAARELALWFGEIDNGAG